MLDPGLELQSPRQHEVLFPQPCMRVTLACEMGSLWSDACGSELPVGLPLLAQSCKREDSDAAEPHAEKRLQPKKGGVGQELRPTQ